jgi:hypothetical protein
MAFPYVDLKTEKIYGCKKNSFEWWHERGHLVYDRAEFTGRIKLWLDYIFFIWMIIITFSRNTLGYILGIILVTVYIGGNFYEEIWCNKYALEHYKEEDETKTN